MKNKCNDILGIDQLIEKRNGSLHGIELIARYALNSFLLLLLLVSVTFSQGSQSTKNKADSDLKSSSRINPATLAMEFSLPLGAYPGRGDHSVPVVFNYSSKVWTMEMTNYRQEGNSVPDNGIFNFLVYETTEVTGQYAGESAAGWTSGVRPPAITGDGQIYDQYAQRHFPAVSQDACRSGIDGTSCEIYDTWYVSVSTSVCASGLAQYTLWLCRNSQTEEPHHTELEANCVVTSPAPPPPAPTPLPTPLPSPTPAPPNPHSGSGLTLKMPDGSSHKFRKDDAIYNCVTDPSACAAQGPEGTYLSVDGARMRLEVGEVQPNEEKRDVLYLPSGGRYIFPLRTTSSTSTINASAEKYVDVNGNISTYDKTNHKWKDTLGREIVDPLPDGLAFQRPVVETKTYNMKGINNADMPYKFKWQRMEDVLDNASQLMPMGRDRCTSVLEDEITGNVLFENQDPPTNDPVQNGIKYIRRQRTCLGYGLGTSGVFNPVVLGEIELPDGSKYNFEYNSYGEISKIVYPTGGYERFEYGITPAIGFSALEIYTQGNRGVTTRYVSFDGQNETEEWNYSSNGATVTTTAPDGTQTETVRYSSPSYGFGFEDPRAGMVKEEKVKDPTNAIRSRKLYEVDVLGPQGPNANENAQRDPRLLRTISINIEGSNALATMSETKYETPGENGSSAPTDLRYFAHLNPTEVKSYHYLSLSLATAQSGSLETIKDLFVQSGQLAMRSKTIYDYDENYMKRGISSLPVESQILNPLNGNVIAKSQTVYDDPIYRVSDSPTLTGYGIDTGYASDTWVDPASDASIPTNSRAKRGVPTATKTWYAEESRWLSAHTQYDQYGNPRKVWDVSNISGKFNETEYSANYHCAYPTKAIIPAPAASSNGHVSHATSQVSTSYDLRTGLAVSVTDDFGQVSTTEYDTLSRPIRANPVVVNGVATGPITETVYGVPDSSGHFPANQRFTKIRKQIEANTWDEMVTYKDSFGRAIKTVSTDSEGEVITETKYDLMGRAYLATNPYRAGNAVFWNRTKFDELGRPIKQYAPAAWEDASVVDPELNVNLVGLSTSSYGISTATNHVGTFVVSHDSSGRKGRSITNVLGQLLRVDEPTAVGGSTDADLGHINSPAQPTYYTYDPYGNLIRVNQGSQNRYFKYDSLGRLTRVRQPEQEVNPDIALYDGYTNTNQWTSAFTYDDLNNVVTATNAKNVTVGNSYDRLGRVLTRAYYGEPTTGPKTPDVYFFYDGKGMGGEPSPNYNKGKLTVVDNGISQTRYRKYDNFGRLKEMEQRTPATSSETTSTVTPRVLKYTYNLSGVMVEEEYPSGRVVKNDLDSDGDLIRVYGRASSNAPEQTYANNFKYTAKGGISQMRLGNGKWETAQFNSRNQTIQLGLGTSATNTSQWRMNYQYGELKTDGFVDTDKDTGSIAKQTLTIPGTSFTQSFKYDALYRLTEAKEVTGTNTNPNWTQTFGYDVYGNRTSLSQNIGGVTYNTTPAVSSSTNRFSSSGFTYDANGNVTADVDAVTSQGRSFVFNADNKQVEIKDANGNWIGKYFYDGEGRRVKKMTPNETTIFVYSNGKLIAEYSTQVSASPTTSYLTSDYLGSPRIITDKFGTVRSRRDFMPFGEDIFVGIGGRTGNSGQKYASSQDDVRHKFTGYQKDSETSLDFAEARMYENRYGRFTAVDPLIASGRSSLPQTFNRYAYVGNNPIIRIDKDGEDWLVAITQEKVNGKMAQVRRPYWAEPKDAPSIAERAAGIWETTVPGERGYQVLHPSRNMRSEVFATRDEAQAQYNKWAVAETLNQMGGSFSDAAYNKTIGTLKGVGNAPFKVWNSLAFNYGPIHISNPFQFTPLTPSNKSQAVWDTMGSTGTILGFGFASAFAPGTAARTLSILPEAESSVSTNFFYSARVLKRSAEDPGPYHNFPTSFDKQILGQGNRTVTPNYYNVSRPGVTNDAVMYELPGQVNGKNGVFEIGTRPSYSGNTEVIWHRFFNPVKK